MRFSAFCLLVCFLFISACGRDDDDMLLPPVVPPPPPVEETDVNFDVATAPFDSLSTYRFFTGSLREMNPNEGLLEYEPISTLFADYAHKTRYIWLPPDTKASYQGDGRVVDFPDGTVILKTFFYNTVLPANNKRIMETRMLYKEAGEWKFAEYIWNEDQTEATLDLRGRNVPLEFIDDAGNERSVVYRIPSEAECLTCHKSNGEATPIGPKPQNLNADYTYPDGSRMNQLSKWQAAGYLASDFDANNIQTVVRWDDPDQDLYLRVRSYIDINCAHCHTAGGHCDYRPIRLAFEESADEVNMGVCVTPDDFLGSSLVNIVSPRNTNKSALFYRLNSTAEMVRMPLLGRTLIHDEGLALIETWINQLTTVCD